MADDLSLIVGRLQGGFDQVLRRLDQQDQQHATDKSEAIQARESKHLENIARFDAMGQRIDRIDGRVTSLEGKRIEARGGAKAWAQMTAMAAAIGGALAGVLEYGKSAIEFLKGLHHG